MKTLSVYLHQQYVGDLIQDSSGQMLFTYSRDWLKSDEAVPLSYSIPLQEKTFTRNQCRGFFAGVLPEDEKRLQISRILGVSAQNDFTLLEQIGGECAGAVTFLPVGQTPEQPGENYRRLSKKELASILRDLASHPLMAGEEDVRLSLAGAQDKLAVRVDQEGGIISIPLNNSPSTHILKPAGDRFKNLVFNEFTCLNLARRMGLSSVASSLCKIEDIDYILVERYDRILSGDSIVRIHQEDFCQAMGIVPEMKYQREGGPSLKQCFELIRMISTHPALDLKKMLDAVIFNYLIGNHDAHGKNFSLLYGKHQVELAPLYDLVCTIYYPELSQKMAMKIGGEYLSNQIERRHFIAFAKEVGLSAPRVCERVFELSRTMIAAASDLKSMQGISQDVLDLIGHRCERANILFR